MLSHIKKQQQQQQQQKTSYRPFFKIGSGPTSSRKSSQMPTRPHRLGQNTSGKQDSSLFLGEDSPPPSRKSLPSLMVQCEANVYNPSSHRYYPPWTQVTPGGGQGDVRPEPQHQGPLDQTRPETHNNFCIALLQEPTIPVLIEFSRCCN